MWPLVGANSVVSFGVYGLSVGVSVCTGSCKDCEVRSLTRTTYIFIKDMVFQKLSISSITSNPWNSISAIYIK